MPSQGETETSLLPLPLELDENAELNTLRLLLQGLGYCFQLSLVYAVHIQYDCQVMFEQCEILS